MHLTKLRLVGFKSFVEANDFVIEPGLTGIVGPNGCGKSNLVEALRWVMGESSYKNMRASGMDDVIFAGGGNRPARNMAEVGLVLDNSARDAPAAFNDADVLEVTRRIERERGSTYRINGREVRARDVQILFADAATGARSPALVRQGQISEIINAKPQARRRILEDAAGVAGLHTRRHEAELRLKGAEDNLARIDDVLTQIVAQSDGLRRQARQAQRFREIQAEIRRTLALAILIDHEDAMREVADAQARLADAAAQVIEWTRAQGETARLQATAAHALPALRDAEVEAGSVLQRFIVARETLDGEERRAKGRLTEIERRIKEMNGDLARDAAALIDATSVMDRLDAEERDLAASTGDEGAEEALAMRAKDVEGRRAEAETHLADAQARMTEADMGRRSLDDRLRDEASRLGRFERDLVQARQSRFQLDAMLGGARDIDQSAETLRLAMDALAASEAKADRTDKDLAAAREDEQAGRAPLAEADRKAQRLETEVRTLSKLFEMGAAAKWAPITDAIRVTKGYEAALGAALGDDLEASADPAAPSHWAQSDGRSDARLPDGAEPLARYVDAPQALHRRLAQIGIVSREAGAALREHLLPGQRLVTLSGDIWRWDGFTQAAEAPTAAARRLVERNRLTDLRLTAEEARATAAQLKTLSDTRIAALAATYARDTAAKGALLAARRASDSAREAHAALERRHGDAKARIATLEATEGNALASRDEAAARKAAIETAIAALPPIDGLKATIERVRADVTAARGEETEVRSSLQSLAKDRETRGRRRAAIAIERASWRTRLEQADGHRADLERRLQEASAERNSLAEAPDHFILARRKIIDDVESAEAGLWTASDARATAEKALADADRGARSAIEAMAKAREDRARAEARTETAAQRRDAIVRTCAADLECMPDALWAMAGVKADQAKPPIAEVNVRLERLKDDRDRLGAVNLRADEELASIDDRRSMLDKEKSDLAEAIRRLRQAIGTLNKEGRERLLGAFTAVDGHFRALFTSLFGGGIAELQLIESDDPLEAGLEILARPPGKRPQVMSLLSGGEQALTAMSLIFAVFLTNPSPICVLDEVDAPLDDANVERFCDLVEEMRKRTDTRFITITHNPITMARMDRLFGVTMAERGVSQLVSVDLAEAQDYLKAV